MLNKSKPIMDTLTETQPPSSHASISQMCLDELEYRLHSLEGYSTQDVTSSNDACYSLQVWITKELSVFIYVPNCEIATEEEDFDTYVVQNEELEYVYEANTIREIVEYLNFLTK
tara:strand:- start:6155 stop:6499 length:345 start_codon:yes stop_codon:yes gene_type:complete